MSLGAPEYLAMARKSKDEVVKFIMTNYMFRS